MRFKPCRLRPRVATGRLGTPLLGPINKIVNTARVQGLSHFFRAVRQRKRQTKTMLHLLAKNWWMLLLRGILAILFGIFAYLWPGLTLLTLIIIYAAYALVDGIVVLLAALTTHPGAGRAGLLALIGILGIAFGLITFFWPGETALVL